MDEPTPHYGKTRNRRTSVTFAEFERAADTLRAGGDKPGLENIPPSHRGVTGNDPLLRRYRTELAALKRSPAEALMRLPSEIADLADELWQRSLSLAAQTAIKDDNAARERLEPSNYSRCSPK